MNKKKQRANEMGCTDATVERYRFDISMNNQYTKKTAERKQEPPRVFCDIDS